MTHEKLRVIRTPLNNVVSNLRGEVAEIVTTWVLLRKLAAESARLSTGDLKADMQDSTQAALLALREKLEDEIVGRLSELGEPKIGRLNFHFAAVKLGHLQVESRAFSEFMKSRRFREKRNYDISHRELPEQWADHKLIVMPYRTILQGIVRAVRLMKALDREVLGPAAEYFWRHMRKSRYDVTVPGRVKGMLMPYRALSRDERAEILEQEIRTGKAVWAEMRTTVNGKEQTILACKEWGALLLDDRVLILERYPLQALSEITVGAGTTENPAQPNREPGV